MTRRLVVDLRATSAAWALRDADAARLRTAAPDGWEVHVVAAPTVSDGDGGAAASPEALAAVAEAEVYAGFGMSRALFDAAPYLRWIHSAAAGVAGLLALDPGARGVLVTNSAGVHAVPIAEWVVGAVLYFLRGFDMADARRHEARWDRDAFVGADTPLREMRDCRALIVGTGGIGTEIARRLSVLGARCAGVRRHPDRGAPAGFDRVVGPGDWWPLLPDSDFLILAAPATGETRRLVDPSVLDALPRQAVVVNVARGALLDEDALVSRLSAGRLRGAALDVFAREPLPAASPLWGLSSVLLTPHVSAVSPRGFWEREMALFLDNWRRYVAGVPLRNVVDARAGY